MSRQLRALARSPLTRQRLTTFISRHRRADLETLARLIQAGQPTPVTGKTCPLRQAPGAMRHLLAGHARGKLALTVTDAG
jgi:NADPH:quinone reductase-like Zn-dependent oxidoreductase